MMTMENDSLGQKMKNLMDEEVKKLLDDSYRRVQQLLKKNQHHLENIAATLLELETLTGKEVQAVLDGKKVHKNGA